MNFVKEVIYRAGLGPAYFKYWWRHRRDGEPKTDWCDRNRAFFVHIPKTAGTSLINALGIQVGSYTHCPASVLRELYPEEFDAYHVFAVVRNPYDKFVSSFEYATKKSDWAYQREWARTYIGDASFNEFVDRLASNAWYRNLILGNEFFLPQAYFVRDSKGGELVDRVLRFETLAEDYEELLGRFPNAVPLLQHTRRNEQRRPVASYYNETTAAFVRNHYKEDFAAFGYSDELH